MEKGILSPIQYIKGVGPHRAALLNRLGINTVRDALFYLPYRYEDRSSVRKIVHLSPGENNTVIGKVLKADVIVPGFRKARLNIFELIVTDGSGIIRAKWFNRAYLKKTFRPGMELVLYGQVKVGFRGSGFEMANPEYEILAGGEEEGNDTAGLHTGRTVPVYRLTEGLSQRQLRNIMYSVVDHAAPLLCDAVPPDIIASHGLPGLRESITGVHFPETGVPLEALNAGATPFHRRLAFDELFTLELGLAVLKRGETLEKGTAFSPDGRHVKGLLERLPFKLTSAQDRVFRDILRDMRSVSPMNRLVQGDVGSGKTVVALMAMLSAVECGYQAALMAPTEILAEQHFINIHGLVEDLGLKIHLITGSRKNKETEVISSGEADLVIGTHALIQEQVSFKKLGLVVIDEQHRFGVMQRATLRKKGLNPDTLIMTATPIPRTLALTLYGDLDYSVIDELPPNRSPIATRLLYEKQKDLIYGMMGEVTAGGGQVYVVYPVIEDSDKTDLKSATNGAEAFRKKFPDLNVGLIHGRMKPAEREEMMKLFKNGNVHVLVSTTVIEVGVDVPNAVLMVIIHAERFGLAQLHQLRGRVGRGSGRSSCILLCYGVTEDSRKRLGVMVKTGDGFRIAEEDLEIRGPGEFFGTKQSGLPDLRIANPVREVKLLESARKEAFELIERDPELRDLPLLRRALEDFWGKRIELFKTA